MSVNKEDILITRKIVVSWTELAELHQLPFSFCKRRHCYRWPVIQLCRRHGITPYLVCRPFSATAFSRGWPKHTILVRGRGQRMSRFKVSKFKNAVPVAAKREVR